MGWWKGGGKLLWWKDEVSEAAGRAVIEGIVLARDTCVGGSLVLLYNCTCLHTGVS